MLSQKAFPDYDMHPLQLRYITLTNYDTSFRNVDIIFNKENLSETLGEILSKRVRLKLELQNRKVSSCYFFL